MKILKGKEIIELPNFNDIILSYKNIIVDIGTGDGRFPYNLAKNNPNNLYIGIDSNADNMIKYSSKSQKKPNKGGLNNILYVVSNAESLPIELENKINKIHINLPWGSLLEGIVKGSDSILDNLLKIASPVCEFQTIFTYNVFMEEAEIIRRGLPLLSLDYIKNTLSLIYKEKNIIINESSIVDNDILKEYNTLWSKRLGFGRNRDVFQLKCSIKSDTIL